MRKYVSKKKLRKHISRLEIAVRNADIRATSASALAILVEKENIQLSRKIKGLENQLNIKKSRDKKMDEFDKSLKHYDWEKKKNPYIGEKTSTDTGTGYHPDKDGYGKIRWTTNPRDFDRPFRNWEN
jgi:hypothetical protein